MSGDPKIAIVFAALGLFVGSVIHGMVAADQPTVAPAPTVVEFKVATQPVKVAAEKERLTLRQRRAMGLTVANIKEAMLELQKDGELSDDPAVASAAVMAKLAERNPKAWSDVASNIDLDAIFEFIMKIVELLMKLLPIFIS